jgi:uncharacterized protein (TIGR00369 family)
MSKLAEAIAAARASGNYDLLLAALPYTRWLGARGQLVGNTVRLCLPFAQRLVGNPVLPAIHGGVVGACLESAALLQIIQLRAGPSVPKTIDFTVDYLRAARALDLYAEAEVMRLGRRIVNVRMRAFQGSEGEPIALGRGNFLVE